MARGLHLSQAAEDGPTPAPLSPDTSSLSKARNPPRIPELEPIMSNTESRQTFARNFVHAVTFRPFLRDLKRMHDAPRLFLRLPPSRAVEPSRSSHAA